jgi:hypothetical protein
MPKKSLTQEDKIFHFSFPSGNEPVVSQKIQGGTLLAARVLETMFMGADLIPMVIEVNPSLPRYLYNKNKSYFEQNKNLLRKKYAQKYPLPSLTIDDIRQIQETGEMPSNYPYTCHHLVPLRWGGRNDIRNLIFLKHDIHQAIHKITDAYIGFLSRQDMSQNKEKSIFLVFPMPARFKGPELRIIHEDKALTVQEWKEVQDMAEAVKSGIPSPQTIDQLNRAIDGEESFFLTYFRKKYAKIAIPGKIRSDNVATHKLSAKEAKPTLELELTPAETSDFLKSINVSRYTHANLFSQQQWEEFQKGCIPTGFSIMPAIPFDSPKYENRMRTLISHEAKDLLKRMLWDPIWRQIQKLRKTVNDIDIQRYHWPKVITLKQAQEFINDNHQEAKLKKSRYQMSEAREQTHITISKNQNGPILYLTNHPFVHQDGDIYTLDTTKICSFAPGKPPIKEPDIIRNLCKRDAFRFKNVSRPEKLRIEKQQRIPDSLGLEARFLIPEEWGGDVSADNALFVKKDIYASYHRTVLMPLALFLSKQNLGRFIQVALPKPLDAYLPESDVKVIKPKAPPTQVRRLASRHNRRQSKIDLRKEWQYS